MAIVLNRGDDDLIIIASGLVLQWMLIYFAFVGLPWSYQVFVVGDDHRGDDEMQIYYFILRMKDD